MSFFLRTGSFYHVTYSRWKTNPDRIYLFILFGNPVLNKVHALNVGARQLTTLDRARIVHTIARLSKVPTASKYTGQVLYRILLTYLKPQVSKCYRTYFHTSITRASLINYGLNKKEDFSPEDFKVYNPQLLNEARADLLVRLINIYTMRGFDVQDLQVSLASVQAKIPSGQPALVTTTFTSTTPPITPTTNVEETPVTEEGNIEGSKGETSEQVEPENNEPIEPGTNESGNK